MRSILTAVVLLLVVMSCRFRRDELSQLRHDHAVLYQRHAEMLKSLQYDQDEMRLRHDELVAAYFDLATPQSCGVDFSRLPSRRGRKNL